jgi:hypothetical protein
MEKEFVDYTEALELKELGFDGPCFGYYFNHSEENFKEGKFDYRGELNIEYSIYKENTYYILAPTYSQAFRFFREKYRLKGEIDTADMIWSKWSFNIELKGSSYILYSGLTEKIYFNSYEEAELECLRKLISIVKEKQL